MNKLLSPKKEIEEENHQIFVRKQPSYHEFRRRSLPVATPVESRP